MREDPRDGVREAVLREGFERVGFARAGELEGEQRFRAWLERGFHGKMDYLARNAEKRVDPRRVLEGAKSVIAMALHYRETSGGVESRADREAGPGEAVISSYAQGADYHRVIEKKLKRICRALSDAFPAQRFRYYVDTGPVLERAWAELAGIGWIGKNTCAIDASHGSYFFIGVILTTLELDADQAAVNHCGSCRLCIDACPTAAIVSPYELDSRLCLSYQTIENRQSIPEALGAELGTLVFGCDICQEVCPFNQRDATVEPVPELQARAENSFPLLEELAGLKDDEAFRKRFPQSAVKRATSRGFLRNVILAIGNSGQQELLPSLDAIAQGPWAEEPVILEALARARSQLD